MPFNYRLRGCINFTRLNKPGQTDVISPIVNRLLRVDVTAAPGKKILVGRIIPIFQGVPDSISYKIYSDSELFLLPNLGQCSLRFISSGILKSGSVRFFEKIGRLSDTELRAVQTSLGLVLDIVTEDNLKLANIIKNLPKDSFEFEFNQSKLDSNNILVFENTLESKPSSIAVYDQSGELIRVDYAIVNNQISVDFSDFIPIVGNWTISISN